jgi:hypothetical protein
MIEPDVTMSREEIAGFLASLKKLRDGLDDFNCHLAAIDGAGMRLGLLCQETAAACPAAAQTLAQSLASAARRMDHCFAPLLQYLPRINKADQYLATTAGTGANQSNL